MYPCPGPLARPRHPQVRRQQRPVRPHLTGLLLTFTPDTSRDAWKPIPRTRFNEGSLGGGDDGLRRVLEMVAAAVRD